MSSPPGSSPRSIVAHDFGAIADRAVTLCLRTPLRVAAVSTFGAALLASEGAGYAFEARGLSLTPLEAFALTTLSFSPFRAALAFALNRALLGAAGCVDRELRNFGAYARAFTWFVIRYVAWTVLLLALLLLCAIAPTAAYSSLARNEFAAAVILAPFAAGSLGGACLAFIWFAQVQTTGAAGDPRPATTARNIVLRRSERFASIVMGAAVGFVPLVVNLSAFEIFGTVLAETIGVAAVHQLALTLGAALCVARYAERPRGRDSNTGRT